MHMIHCRTFAFSILILAVAGCSPTGSQKKSEITEDYFTPIPPDLPLIQYVRSFNGSADFREKNALIDYISGRENVKDYVIEKAFSVASVPGKLYVTDSFGAKGLNVFERYLTLWVILCIAGGIVLGKVAPVCHPGRHGSGTPRA